jgi:hypothetical protein
LAVLGPSARFVVEDAVHAWTICHASRPRVRQR